mgnify:CR=1 FL=1
MIYVINCCTKSDAAGNVGSSSVVAVTVNNATGTDTTPPTTAVSSPSAGAQISGTISIAASASDNVGVTKVEFFVDGSLIGSAPSAPYSAAWNTTTATNGAHSLTTRAFDAAGNVGTSAAVSITVNNNTTGSALQNGVPESNLGGAAGSTATYTLSVPSGATSLSFKLSGGTGDADMYVKFGSAPTTSSYDCRPYVNGNNETCDISAVQAGTYYVMIQGFAAYSGGSLVGSFSSTASNVLTNGVATSAISGAASSAQYFTLEVPASATSLSFAMSGGTGDADMYVRFGAAPTTTTYDCRPYLGGNNETCNVTPKAGTYYVMIRGYAAFSGTTLKGTFAP